MASSPFSSETLAFLAALAENNERPWFDAHKDDYEAHVRGPALDFISAMVNDLAGISEHFVASARPMGGSLMRIHRDVRFGHDKRPYKTNIGIQFRHELGKDVHAPGFYLHVEPANCFIGVGLWHPDAPALGRIRDALVAKPKEWLKARDDKAFRKLFELTGDTLSNPPRGFAKDHPLIEDLKRKDFIALAGVEDAFVLSPSFRKRVTEHFRSAKPYMAFLCGALELQF